MHLARSAVAIMCLYHKPSKNESLASTDCFGGISLVLLSLALLASQ